MSSRRSIILVSKTWHRIVLPCLFEEVVILDQRRHRCEGLLNVLEKYSLGHYVRRLDLYLRSPGSYSEDATLKALDSLFQCCPNLHVVTVRNVYGSDRVFLDQVLQYIFALPNLQILDFPWWNCHADFVATLSNSTIRATSFYASPNPALLPALSQIYVPEPYILLPTPILDNVTSLILDYTSAYDPLHSYLSQLISGRRSLARVRYLTVYHSTVEEHNRNMASSIPLTAPSRPGLQKLPASVHTLAFWFRQPKATTRTWRKFCRTLSLIDGEGIKVIRFGVETAEDLRSRHIAYEIMNETLQAKGWRLEAGDLCV